MEQEDYNTAFDFLTRFYKERQVVDLTDDEAMNDDPSDEPADTDGTTLTLTFLS